MQLPIFGSLDDLPLRLWYDWGSNPRQPFRQPPSPMVRSVMVAHHPARHPVEPGQSQIADGHVAYPTPCHRKDRCGCVSRTVITDATEAIRTYRAIVLLVEPGETSVV